MPRKSAKHGAKVSASAKKSVGSRRFMDMKAPQQGKK